MENSGCTTDLWQTFMRVPKPSKTQNIAFLATGEGDVEEDQERICEPAKTELASDLQKCADLRQLLTHWVSDRGYSVKQVTHSIETNSHKIIGNVH